MTQRIYHEDFDLEGEIVRIKILVANPAAQLITVLSMTDPWCQDGEKPKKFGSVLVRDADGPRVHERIFFLIRMRGREMPLPDEAAQFIGRIHDSRLSTWLVFAGRSQSAPKPSPQPQAGAEQSASPPPPASNGSTNGRPTQVPGVTSQRQPQRVAQGGAERGQKREETTPSR